MNLSLEMLSSSLVKIPYSVLIVFTIMMLLAPMAPMPHVVEKNLMLTNGALTRPIDIFDLCFHLFPLTSSDPKIHKRLQMNTLAEGVWSWIKSFAEIIVQYRPTEICFRVLKQENRLFNGAWCLSYTYRSSLK
nr:hypothetical protein [uncultured Desulfobacter sp.]